MGALGIINFHGLLPYFYARFLKIWRFMFKDKWQINETCHASSLFPYFSDNRHNVDVIGPVQVSPYNNVGEMQNSIPSMIIAWRPAG